MKCESCNIRKIEAEELSDEGQNPYRLCLACHDRLLKVIIWQLKN